MKRKPQSKTQIYADGKWVDVEDLDKPIEVEWKYETILSGLHVSPNFTKDVELNKKIHSQMSFNFGRDMMDSFLYGFVGSENNHGADAVEVAAEQEQGQEKSVAKALPDNSGVHSS